MNLEKLAGKFVDGINDFFEKFCNSNITMALIWIALFVWGDSE